MLKYISTADFKDGAVIPLFSDNEFIKTASQAQVVSEAKDFTLKLPHSDEVFYCLVVALGAGEYWGPNRNGDYFPEEELKKSYHTFKDGHVFEQHQNNDPAKSIGRVIEAFWNDRLKRVELVIEVNREKGKKYLERLENGEPVDVSMGCKVEFDVCSICGNKSRTRAEYCNHLRYHMNEILPDGRQVYAINPNPKFFDISFVKRGADPTAKVLLKVASDMQKESEIQKEVPAMSVRKLSPSEVKRILEHANADLQNAPDIPPELLDEMLSIMEPHELMVTLARAGIPLKVKEVHYVVKSYPLEISPELLQKLILYATEKLDALIKLPEQLLAARTFIGKEPSTERLIIIRDPLYDAYQYAIIQKMASSPTPNVTELAARLLSDPKFQKLLHRLTYLLLILKNMQGVYPALKTLVSLEHGVVAYDPRWENDVKGAWDQASKPILYKSGALKTFAEQHGNHFGAILYLSSLLESRR